MEDVQSTAEKNVSDLSDASKFLPYGFCHLRLNLWQHDREKLDAKYTQLMLIRHDLREPRILHDALDLWMAHIINVNPRRKEEALRKMEDIAGSKHINALADLYVIYTNLGREHQAQKQAKMLHGVLEKSGSDELIAMADFEQAFVILFTEPENSNESIVQRLKETGDIIRRHMEHIPFPQHQIGETDLKSALRNVSIATLYTTQANYKTEQAFKKETLTRYRECMDKLIKALAVFKVEDATRASTYKYLLYFKAFAHLRIQKQNGNGLKGHEYLEHYQTIAFFYDFIESLTVDEMESFVLYKGRALAHIAAMVPINREILPDELINLESICHEAEELLKTPVNNPPDQTYELDYIGAERLARTNILIATKTPIIRKQRTEEARRYLDMALKSPEKCGWFTYAMTRDVHYKLFKYSTGTDRVQHLMKAYENGCICISSKRTPRDLIQLGEICFEMSRQDIISCGQYKYLNESVSYLTEAIIYGGEKNYFASWNMGRSLKNLGENRSALEWMKKAMRLADPHLCYKKFGFPFPFMYLIEEYGDLKLPVHEKAYLLLEFQYLVQEGIDLFGSVHRELRKAFQSHERICFAFLKFIILHPFKLGRHQATVTDHCLQILRNISADERCNLREQAMQRFATEKIKEANGEDKFDFSDMKMPDHAEGKMKGMRYLYDFFVCYSTANEDWVRGKLLPFLERKLHCDDEELVGCLDDRNFTPGKSIISNTIDAIQKSRILLLVISPEFNQCRWRDFETDQALLDFINNGRDCIVPLQLVECPIPKKLETFPTCSVTDRTTQDEELQKLKIRISSARLFDL